MKGAPVSVSQSGLNGPYGLFSFSSAHPEIILEFNCADKSHKPFTCKHMGVAANKATKSKLSMEIWSTISWIDVLYVKCVQSRQ